MGVGQSEYITSATNPYQLPTMNINYLLPFDDFKRLVNRTDPDYTYYPESQAIEHIGSHR